MNFETYSYDDGDENGNDHVDLLKNDSARKLKVQFKSFILVDITKSLHSMVLLSTYS
jgi:hypothetical protein